MRNNAGIRADAKAAKVVKDTGQNPPGYNPQGLGAAWSHNFLNQKPWHPANFRNQAKVYEAEQNAIREQKAKAQAKVCMTAPAPAIFVRQMWACPCKHSEHAKGPVTF